MQFKTIISSASAAALAFGMSAAFATPPGGSTPSSEYHSGSAYQSKSTAEQVANEAATVLRDNVKTTSTTSTTGKQEIPQQAVNTARCIAVFPNVASAGESGMSSSGETSGAMTTSTATENTGLASCRDDQGQWSAAPVVVKLSDARIQPASMTSSSSGTGASSQSEQQTMPSETAGQMSGHAVVLLFTSEDSADSLQSGDVKLGEDVHVVPGSTGSETASTHMTESSEEAPVIAYQAMPQQGASGAEIQSGNISFDEQANEQTYGNSADPKDLLKGEAEQEHVQKAAQLVAFSSELNRLAPASRYQKARTGA